MNVALSDMSVCFYEPREYQLSVRKSMCVNVHHVSVEMCDY